MLKLTIEKDFPALEEEYLRLKPTVSIDMKAKIFAYEDLHLKVRKAVDSIRTNFTSKSQFEVIQF